MSRELILTFKAMRKRAGQTQEQAAHEMGVTMNAVSLWERGERKPTGLYRKAVEDYIAKYGKEK